VINPFRKGSLWLTSEHKKAEPKTSALWRAHAGGPGVYERAHCDRMEGLRLSRAHADSRGTSQRRSRQPTSRV